MKCPIDSTELTMSERQGVEIDYCPSCRGVWLDRGELDKILDRAALGTAPAAVETRDSRSGRDDHDDSHHGERHDPRRDAGRGTDGRPQARKGKGSWLGDLLDFG